MYSLNMEKDASTKSDNSSTKKPTIYEFSTIFRLRVIAMDEKSGLEQAKKQMSEKMGLPMEFVEEAFKDGLRLNQTNFWLKGTPYEKKG